MPTFDIVDKTKEYDRVMHILIEWLQEVCQKFNLNLDESRVDCMEAMIGVYIMNNEGGMLDTDNLQLYGAVSTDIIFQGLTSVDIWVRLTNGHITKKQFTEIRPVFEQIYFKVCPEFGSQMTTNRRCMISSNAM
jgi:hypothetical protein